ncbi:MAG: ATP-binding cassette domain-containing protein [Treponema sp.]|nr:ATP-binding cassette domain-containing protein [Treponema sp.]
MDNVLLRCEDLSFGYEGRLALEGLAFSVEAGDRFCVVGENGSGKSTLLKGLLGLIPPAGGRLVKNPRLKRGDIGYLSQESPLRKDFPAAVEEVVLSGRQSRRGFAPFYTGADRAAAEESLEIFGLTPLRRACFRELSGGQRRRVLLARSLCAADRLLFLDEPASGLDPVIQNDLYRILERINGERGITVIMVSHDIEGALRFTAPREGGAASGGGGTGKMLHLGVSSLGGASPAGRQLFFGGPERYRESGPGKMFLGGLG